MLKPTRAMSDRHEDHLAALFEGRKTRGSGNQSRDQMDGKQQYRSGHFVFAWDGKATLAKSLTVTLEMWRKAKEQAHWATPILPLRFYASERLTDVHADLVVVEADVLADMQREANLMGAVKDQGCLQGTHAWAAAEDGWDTYTGCSVCGTTPAQMA